MKIQVTQEDIDHGEKKDCSKCPIALAVGRAFKTSFVTVGECAMIQINNQSFDSKQSKEIDAFIENFDSGNIVEPFEFELHEYINEDEPWGDD